ncbi:MAG: beta-ketoacyl-ACP reductase [Lewinellaceae bacterium]|nr:beta-ketoacyl-ACP reductase [Phaeodactylibacter sp.]MCB9351479.1 beta-ketoacyl-ACP reductase [Lewinellaceae bacterium]
MYRLKDKVAIITGGASGIGKATAKRFIEEGARVVIWDINREKGLAVASELNILAAKLAEKAVEVPVYEAGKQNGNTGTAELYSKFYEVNTTKLANTEAAAREVIEDFGKADILINNAGITRDATMKKMTPEQWQLVIDVNLTGVWNCTKAVSPYMVERNYGRIISAASVVGLHGNFGQTNYVATKAGVIGMTKVWAREFARKGITANAVAPGFIATDMVATIPEKVIQMIEDKTPVGRMGKPEEIANAYLFLASDEAAFVNGITLSVDGGLIL